MGTTKDHTPIQKAFGLLCQEPLSRYTSFRVGGPADLLALPRDRSSLLALVKAAGQEGLAVTFLGGGTNTLVSDKGIRGLVIVLTSLKSVPCLAENTLVAGQKTLRADAGERLSTVCRFALDQGLSGLEFAAGIPGTLGGAIYMNAGTADQEISSVIGSVDFIDTQTFSFQTLERKELDFSYRTLAAKNMVLVGACLNLTLADPEKIQKKIDQNLKMKKATQPLSAASAGCFFKNPSPQNPAGRLIEQAGLKGKKINDAQVSDLHANYIVNVNQARCEDILALKTLVQKTVFEKFGIMLETEIQVMGE